MLETLLHRFAATRVPGPYTYTHQHHHRGRLHDKHLVVGCMVHGNEVGSLPAVLHIIAELTAGKLRFGGRLTLFIGNPEAGMADRRFLESDLNRVFVDEPPDTHEGRRARALKPILDDADIFLDLHQTILQTERPFYICPWNSEGWRWARIMAGATHWVTRAPNQSFSAGTCCADEYVRLRGRPGITLELGQAGFASDAAERAYYAIVAAMRTMDAIADGSTTLDEAASLQPELVFVHTVHRERFSSPLLRLREGLSNFVDVSAGDELSAPGTPQMLAPEGGMVLFPKYVERIDGVAVDPRPGEIYRIVKPLPSHPLDLWGSTSGDDI